MRLQKQLILYMMHFLMKTLHAQTFFLFAARYFSISRTFWLHTIIL
jgi:hypothetical protein